MVIAVQIQGVTSRGRVAASGLAEQPMWLPGVALTLICQVSAALWLIQFASKFCSPVGSPCLGIGIDLNTQNYVTKAYVISPSM